MKIKIDKQKKQLLIFTGVIVIFVLLVLFLVVGSFEKAEKEVSFSGEDLNLPASKNEAFKNKKQIHSLLNKDENIGSEDLDLEDVYKEKKTKKEPLKKDHIKNYDSLVYQTMKGGKFGGSAPEKPQENASSELTKRERELLAQKKILESQLSESQKSQNTTASNSKTQTRPKKLSKKQRMQKQMNRYFQKSSLQKSNAFATKKARIPAYITHTEGNVFQGDRIELRLQNRTQIKGRWFPAHTIFYGFIRFGDHRLFIKISNIAHVKVEGYAVYDATDGSEGVFVKGRNLLQELKQYTREQTMQSGEVSLAGATTTAQLINGAKGLVSRKMEKPSVTIHNGTKVYLMKH